MERPVPSSSFVESLNKQRDKLYSFKKVMRLALAASVASTAIGIGVRSSESNQRANETAKCEQQTQASQSNCQAEAASQVADTGDYLSFGGLAGVAGSVVLLTLVPGAAPTETRRQEEISMPPFAGQTPSTL